MPFLSGVSAITESVHCSLVVDEVLESDLPTAASHLGEDELLTRRGSLGSVSG